MLTFYIYFQSHSCTKNSGAYILNMCLYFKAYEWILLIIDQQKDKYLTLFIMRIIFSLYCFIMSMYRFKFIMLHSKYELYN